MQTTHIGLCLTVLICNFTFCSNPQPDLIKDNTRAEECLKALLQAEKADLDRINRLIAKGDNKQNKKRDLSLLLSGICAMGSISLIYYEDKIFRDMWQTNKTVHISGEGLLENSDKKLGTIEEYNIAQLSHFRLCNLLLYGLVACTVGSLIYGISPTHSNTDTFQAEAQQKEYMIKGLKEVLRQQSAQNRSEDIPHEHEHLQVKEVPLSAVTSAE